ncbi:hypothetical protein F7018_18135 [Tenacibaculum aiptasiae]|uniref:Uncharacterized protein n=1 Tax=Tenacibaculum aiptasiae TaxID=426481 RepID=A0A7J5A4W3_9FLAO|nr:hypothetical protein [Tenacibaculum aiptasiae]KAB1151407.1 hypothetical protein F7018_18135 [Tenacibaculum aiptasiae]
MKNINALRRINRELKYNSIIDYIGIEIPIDISKNEQLITEEVKFLVEESLNIQIKSSENNNIKGTIAKYGLIDINFEIESKAISNSNNGIQFLKDNGWIDKESTSEFQDDSFLTDILSDLNENKIYLKIYAVSTNQKEKWFKNKSYLFKQFINGEELRPKPNDKIITFKIKDMCMTNYSGIWLGKYFYL